MSVGSARGLHRGQGVAPTHSLCLEWLAHGRAHPEASIGSWCCWRSDTCRPQVRASPGPGPLGKGGHGCARAVGSFSDGLLCQCTGLPFLPGLHPTTSSFMFPNTSPGDHSPPLSPPYSPALHLSLHSTIIYLLVCLSPPPACEPLEGRDTVLFTDVSLVLGMAPNT